MKNLIDPTSSPNSQLHSSTPHFPLYDCQPLPNGNFVVKPLKPKLRGSTRDAAKILGCSASLIRQLIALGELEGVERPGKRVYLLDLEEVQRYRKRKMTEAQLI